MTLRALVPLDGSQASLNALTGALRLLHGRHGLHLTLLTVISEGMSDVDADRRREFEKREDDEVFTGEADAQPILRRAVDACQAADVPHKTTLVEGSVYETIRAACKEHDLLIMHRLDANQLRESLRGSRTEKLARRAGIPVLLV